NVPPYPRLRSTGVSPMPASKRATAIQVGVLPAPPSVRLPTHTTGTPARQPGRASLRAAMAPYTAATGASSPASQPAVRHQNAGAELDRLYRVLSAMARERAADKHDRRHAINEPKLAERIDHVDIVGRFRQAAVGAQPRRQARRLGDLHDARPAIGMTWRDHG